MDRSEALNYANAHGVILAGFDDDYEVVSSACGINAQAILSASKRLKTNSGIIKIASKDGRFNLRNFLKTMIDEDNTLCKNDKFMKCALLYNESLLELASDEVKDDYDVVLGCIKKDPNTIKFASKRLQRDFTLLKILDEDTDFDLYDFLDYLVTDDKSLLDDYDFMNEALKYNQSLLMNASEAIRGDKDIVIRCVSEFGFLFNYATLELQYDRDVIYAAIQGYKNDYKNKNYSVSKNVIAKLFKNYSDEVKDDYNIAAFAVISNSNNIRCVSTNLKETTNIIKLGLISSIKEYFEKSGNPKAEYIEEVINTVNDIQDGKVVFDKNEEYNIMDEEL